MTPSVFGVKFHTEKARRTFNIQKRDTFQKRNDPREEYVEDAKISRMSNERKATIFYNNPAFQMTRDRVGFRCVITGCILDGRWDSDLTRHCMKRYIVVYYIYIVCRLNETLRMFVSFKRHGWHLLEFWMRVKSRFCHWNWRMTLNT